MSQLDKYKDTKPEEKPVEKKMFDTDDVERIIKEREQQKQQPSSEPTLEEPVDQRSRMRLSRHQKESEPEVNPDSMELDAVFTKKDRMLYSRRHLEGRQKQGVRYRRSEKKDIENLEYDKTQHTRSIIIILAVSGLIFVGFVRPYLPNEAMYSIILIMGMMLFFPCGMIAGWIFLDPVMRCKILRKTTKKNYGIVGFVGKGMKAVLKIKNFDDGIIWREKACWVITKDKIVQTTKDANAIVNKERVIDPESVITLVDTVPMIYVDLDSMEPLMLHQKGREAVYPLEIGATLKAWEDNQRAKMMALKKMGDVLLYVTIICAAGALVVSFLNYQKIDTMSKDISTIHSILYNMSQVH